MKLFSHLAFASLAVAGKAKKNKIKTEKKPEFSFGDLTCTTEHIPVLFDLAGGVQIVRNTNKNDGSREFLLGCDETMTEPNYNVITCMPETDGKADGTGMVGVQKLVAEKWIDRFYQFSDLFSKFSGITKRMKLKLQPQRSQFHAFRSELVLQSKNAQKKF